MTHAGRAGKAMYFYLFPEPAGNEDNVLAAISTGFQPHYFSCLLPQCHSAPSRYSKMRLPVLRGDLQFPVESCWEKMLILLLQGSPHLVDCNSIARNGTGPKTTLCEIHIIEMSALEAHSLFPSAVSQSPECPYAPSQAATQEVTKAWCSLCC